MTRSYQMNLRLTRQEHQVIHRAAKRAGLPASEWVRMAALAAAGHCPMCGVGNFIDAGRSHSPGDSPDDSK